MEIEAKKCTLGKRKGSNQHRFVDCCLLSFPRFVHPTVYITIKGLYTSTRGCIDLFPYCMMSSGRSILASSLLYSIILCFIIIFHKDNLSER